jgi:molybdopterin/thiamine biosynthesis adenylyltransferase
MIGCGGIGSFTALGLAKLGVPNLTFLDPDYVEDHNVPNQLFAPDEISENKALACANMVQVHNEFASVDYHPSKGEDMEKYEGLVISGLDSMDARKEIWEQCIKLKPRVPLYIDARLSGQFIIAYAVNPCKTSDIKSYELTLHSDEEAEDISCTERGIIDVGLQVASLLTRLVRMHFTGDGIPAITMMNQETYVTTQGAWVE